MVRAARWLIRRLVCARRSSGARAGPAASWCAGQAAPSSKKWAGAVAAEAYAANAGGQPAVPGQDPAQRGHGVAVRRAVVGAGLAPHGADDVVAEAIAEVLPERPVAVLVEAAGVEQVQRAAGPGDLAVGQVAPVVVGAVGDPLLHPGRPSTPAARGPRGSRSRTGSAWKNSCAAVTRRLTIGLLAVLLAGEVVVEHAVARGHLAQAGHAVLRGAVAVETLRPEVLQVDVEPTVAAVPSVARRRPEAHPAHLGAPDPVHHPERGASARPRRAVRRGCCARSGRRRGRGRRAWRGPGSRRRTGRRARSVGRASSRVARHFSVSSIVGRATNTSRSTIDASSRYDAGSARPSRTASARSSTGFGRGCGSADAVGVAEQRGGRGQGHERDNPAGVAGASTSAPVSGGTGKGRTGVDRGGGWVSWCPRSSRSVRSSRSQACVASTPPRRRRGTHRNALPSHLP